MPDKTLDEAKSIEAIDVFGKVETRGVDFIPEKERHSKPQELAWVFFGAQITYGSLLIGALPVAFGLNWLQALTAIVVGTVLGSLALGAMAWLGPRTGTNGTVSSSAFFGIRGRYVGSFISQTIDLGYFAMTLWFSVPPILEGLNMLFGWPTTGPIVTVALVIVALVILAFGIFGHATIVAYEKFTAIAGLVCMLMLTYFTISHWHPPATPPALLLGSFWPTWAIGVTVTIANAISYSPYASDYSRYMPTASKPKILFGWSLFGMIAGCTVGLVCGEIIGFGVENADSAVNAMVLNIPLPFMAPVLLLGFIGNVSNGGILVYNGVLDLHAILWRLKRSQVGIIFGVIGLVVGYLGLVVFNLVDSILALCSIVTVLVTPWVTINIIGWYQHRGEFRPYDLQAFAHHTDRGIYWYTNGFNIGAVLAWIIGVAVGLLFTNTNIFTGPLANVADGVDLSFISSAIVGSVIYLIVGRVSAAHNAIPPLPNIADGPIKDA